MCWHDSFVVSVKSVENGSLLEVMKLAQKVEERNE